MRGVGDPLRAYRLSRFFNTHVDLTIAYLSNFYQRHRWIHRPTTCDGRLGVETRPHPGQIGRTAQCWSRRNPRELFRDGQRAVRRVTDGDSE